MFDFKKLTKKLEEIEPRPEDFSYEETQNMSALLINLWASDKHDIKGFGVKTKYHELLHEHIVHFPIHEDISDMEYFSEEKEKKELESFFKDNIIANYLFVFIDILPLMLDVKPQPQKERVKAYGG